MPLYEYRCSKGEYSEHVVERRYSVSNRKDEIKCPEHPNRIAHQIFSGGQSFEIKNKDW